MEFTYKLIQNQPNSILRIEDSVTIPQGINGDWQLYEKWLQEGNTPLPADELPPPVKEIDARRLRLALLELDLLDIVEDAITTLGRAAQIEWEFATIIKEDYPLVMALSSQLGLNVEEIFNLALTIQ